MRKVKKRKGFTLIELMIVVAIIGILAAIAIPAYMDYTVKAKVSEVMHQFDALATALSEYHSDVGKFPSTTNFNPTDWAAVHSKYGNFDSSATAASGNLNNHINVSVAVDVGSRINNTITMILRYNTTTGYDKNWSGITTATKQRLFGKGLEWE
ncbi:MAG TPA: pilin [Desulfobacterales bacterium]|nr:pilin [Desulfobacterales bacterium]